MLQWMYHYYYFYTVKLILVKSHFLEDWFTVALSRTLMEFSSATFLLRKASSSVHRGRVSHFPKTTRSISLSEGKVETSSRKDEWLHRTQLIIQNWRKRPSNSRRSFDCFLFYYIGQHIFILLPWHVSAAVRWCCGFESHDLLKVSCCPSSVCMGSFQVLVLPETSTCGS